MVMMISPFQLNRANNAGGNDRKPWSDLKLLAQFRQIPYEGLVIGGAALRIGRTQDGRRVDGGHHFLGQGVGEEEPATTSKAHGAGL